MLLRIEDTVIAGVQPIRIEIQASFERHSVSSLFLRAPEMAIEMMAVHCLLADHCLSGGREISLCLAQHFSNTTTTTHLSLPAFNTISINLIYIEGREKESIDLVQGTCGCRFALETGNHAFVPKEATLSNQNL